MRAYTRSVAAAAPQGSREELIAAHLDMARRIALRIARKTPEWMSPDDLVAAAMVGLAEAADRYNESRGEPFVGFAEKRVRGAVLDELRRGDIMPRRVRTMARKVGKTIRDLENKLGRSPEDTEVAESLGVPLEEYQERLEMLTHVNVVEFEPHDEDRTFRAPEDKSSPEQLFAKTELLSKLKSGLTKLAERDALVLSLYYVEELSYAEIAEVLEVSESRVCQLHARAISRLRAEMIETEEQEQDNG